MIDVNLAIALFAAAAWRSYVLLGGVVFFIAAVVFFTLWAVRRRRRVWAAFARRHGLEFSKTDGHPRVTGQIGKRDVELRVSGQSSDTGLAGLEKVEMRLALSCPVSAEFQVTNSGRLGAVLEEMVQEDIVATGDEEFDMVTALRTSEPDVVLPYLSRDRRAAILQLIDEQSGCDVHVTDSEILVSQRLTTESVHLMDERLQSMLALAARLEERRSDCDGRN